MYAKRTEKIWESLSFIALKGEAYQSGMEKKLGCSYRNLLRQLHLLERSGLICIVRKETSAKKGKEKNVWSLTFTGILAILSLHLAENTIDRIAAANKDKWLVFQEWGGLTKDAEVKNLIVTKIGVYASQHSIFKFCKDSPFYANIPLGKEPRQFLEHYHEREATLAALWLDMVFDTGMPEEFYEHKDFDKLWKTAINIESIHQFVLEQLRFERERHKSLMKFKEYLLHEGEA